MTLPRIICENDTFYHVMNRVCGPKDHFPIDDVVKQKFLDLMNHLLELHGDHIKILSYVIMDNHYHLVLAHDSTKELTEAEVQYRFFNYYNNEKHHLAWQEGFYEKYQTRMQSLSWFIGELDRRLAAWYNAIYHKQLFGKKRRGHFWQNRFKSCVLDSSVAARNCIAYVECNPLRAGLVENPSDYHFSSYGRYKGTGAHPFAENFAHYFLEDEYDNPLSPKDKFSKCIKFLENSLSNRLQLEKDLTEIEAQKAFESSPFETLTRRISYWNDSRIIFCNLKKSDAKENIHAAKIVARKSVHEYKDKLGNIFQPFNWHKLIPEPDS